MMNATSGYTLVVALIVAAAAAFFYFGDEQKAEPKVDEKLTIGAQNTVLSALFHIARAKGFFKDEGVEVETKIMSSGPAANEAILAGEVDMISTSESAIIIATKIPSKVIVTLSIGKNRRRIMVPPDSDVRNISDLSGKRIGMKKTGSFYGNWLLFEKYYGIKAAEVVDIESNNLPEALRTKQVDAVFSREPISSLIEAKGYGRWVHVMQVPGMEESTVFIAKESTLKQKPEAVKKFIHALKKAEIFMKENPNESVEIMARVVSLPYNITARSMEFSIYTTNTTKEVIESYDMVADFFLNDSIITKKPDDLFDLRYYNTA